jgi:hypothetical protein
MASLFLYKKYRLTILLGTTNHKDLVAELTIPLFMIKLIMINFNKNRGEAHERITTTPGTGL